MRTGPPQALLLYLGNPGGGGGHNLLHLLPRLLQDLQGLPRLHLLDLCHRCSAPPQVRQGPAHGRARLRRRPTVVLPRLELRQALLHARPPGCDALFSARRRLVWARAAAEKAARPGQRSPGCQVKGIGLHRRGSSGALRDLCNL